MEKTSYIYVIIKEQGEFSTIFKNAYTEKANAFMAIRDYEAEYPELKGKLKFIIKELKLKD